MQLYLIRHPRPAVAEGTCYGRSDLGLADDAQAVARRLAPLLPADATVHSSPLQRCRQLAEALHPAPQFSEHLLEMDFGAWEMRPWNDLPRAEMDAWVADMLGYRPPGGESVADMRARVLAFFDALPRQQPAVLVCHAGIMKCFAGYLLGLPTEEWFKASFEFGSITRFDHGPDGWQRVWHNKS